MDYDFKDKTVIITGGSEGVGAATARKFAEYGANLVLVARSKRNLDRIAEELRGKTRVETVAMDVSDTVACVNLFKKAEFEFGNINILINNAGYQCVRTVRNGQNTTSKGQCNGQIQFNCSTQSNDCADGL